MAIRPCSEHPLTPTTTTPITTTASQWSERTRQTATHPALQAASPRHFYLQFSGVIMPRSHSVTSRASPPPHHHARPHGLHTVHATHTLLFDSYIIRTQLS
ncbi:hypothetical protein E2C01_098514 [Portunus trituberculatus]|uniref:Uncharacterized protein n=1 Tax=Portunus trituberculatus TaxID=210409 RepID=A0A5B7KED8_PORTR|nr:hypothetical protein [Portunus trituberculatus]